METVETANLVQTEVFHRDYHIDKRDNLDSLPAQKAVYGIFAIIREKPVHCRYVGETANLQKSVRKHFESEKHAGLRKFMQGPWIPMVVYQLLPDSKKAERLKIVQEWVQEHNPKCDNNAEYPE